MDNERKIYSSRYVRVWQTYDSFGFSVIVNFDYKDLIIRVGTLVFCIGG